ncbi:MAG: hypothetical protein SGARI_004303 [Bacillariaceae sp.]
MADSDTTTALLAQALAAILQKDAALREKDAALRQKDAELAALRQENQQKEDARQHLLALVETKDGEISGLRQENQQKDAEIGDLRQRLQRANRIRQQQEADLAERDPSPPARRTRARGVPRTPEHQRDRELIQQLRQENQRLRVTIQDTILAVLPFGIQDRQLDRIQRVIAGVGENAQANGEQFVGTVGHPLRL